MTARGWIEYDIVWVFPSGRVYSERRMCPRQSIQAAAAWAKEHERKIYESGPPDEERKTVPTFGEFSQRWLIEYDAAQRHKPSTIITKKWILGSHLARFNSLRLDQIGAAEVAKLKASLAESGLAAKSTNNVLSILGKLLKTAEKWGEIEKAPAVELVKQDKRVMPFFSTETYDALVEGARKVSPETLAIVLLAGDAGLRKGEITALEWPHVDLARRVIVVQQSETKGFVTSLKGRAWRAVPLTEELTAALEAIQEPAGRVIKGRTRSGGIERKTMSAMVRDAERAAGLPETGRLHVLRHTYGSHAAEAGQSLYHLQMAMGHADRHTTEDYAKMNAQALRPLAAAVDARRRERQKRLGDD